MERIQSRNVQILRGVAIIAVVLIHNTPEGISQVVFRPFLNFCVGLFLFMSAMLSNADKWNPKKRIAKVMIPYILWTVLYVIFKNIRSPSLIPIAVVKNLITAKAAAPLYFVFVYCELTLLIPAIDRLARSRYKYWGFVIAPLEVLFLRLLPLVFGIKINAYVKLLSSISCVGWFSYYYLGYLLGNKLIDIKIPTKRLFSLLAISVAIQFAEGYWYYRMGEGNCGTQLKLSALLTGSIFVIIAYRYACFHDERKHSVLKALGDNSFGIFFSHIAVMRVLSKLSFYSVVNVYPINAIVVIAVDMCCIYIGKAALGKYSKYLAI